MENKVFKIGLDTEILRKLRNKINEQKNISYKKMYGKYRAWDKICAIMNRLDDTVEYLNTIELNTGKYKRSAFDFFDFMNNASVVIDCVKELSKIFEVSDSEIKNSTNIFNKVGSDGNGTDEKYFEYLRSLCSVHPVETSRHKRYQDNDFECSPYVLWNNSLRLFNDDCDIYAVVYTSKDNESFKRVGIYIEQVFKYVEIRVNFIEKIIDYIDTYQKDMILKLKKQHIKNDTEFNSYIEYLTNLDEEAKDRYGDDHWYSFEYVIKLLQLKLSDSENENKMKLYINALKYAIKFEHNALQNMSNIGYENSGLKYSKENIETSLYIELYSPSSGSKEERRYGYNIEKIQYLSYDSGDSNKDLAYVQLNEAREFFEKYVSFKNVKSDFEYYALVNLALYLECLENDCIINKNIPNYLKYREKLL